MSPRSLPLSVLVILITLLTLPVAAQLPTHEFSTSAGIWDSAELGNEPAIGASYNRYWSSLFSTRVGGFVAKDDDVPDGGDLTNVTMHLSGEIHLFRGSRVSPWAGAGGAFVHNRLSLSNRPLVARETTFTGIYSGGVDVAVSPRFAVGVEGSYMNYEAVLDSRLDYSVDPMTFLLTARWRF